MVDSFIMRTSASYSLNFMVYIQNIYLNQNSSEKDEYKFPYIPALNITFQEKFESSYIELWDEITRRITAYDVNDTKIFYEDKELFYQSLFVNCDSNLKEFNEIYNTFIIWWESFAGHFAIERSIDEVGQELYADLANILPKKDRELNISLIYDECPLVGLDLTLDLVIIPIKDFFVKYEVLVSNLRGRIE